MTVVAADFDEDGWPDIYVAAVTSQFSYYSVNDSRFLFGLGTAKAANLEIYWPNGLVERLKNVAGGQLLTLKEGNGPVPSKGF